MFKKKQYTVMWKTKVGRNVRKLPVDIQEKVFLLLKDLEEQGPHRKNWSNFSSIGKNVYHCHLSYHYVACWRWMKKTIEIEVIYVGSREKAPY